MNVELFVYILLGILLAFSTWMAGEYWKEKEHYRHRVYELTKGKEDSNLVKVPTPPPPPAPEGLSLTRPFFTEWLHNGSGEYFRRKDVVALTMNANHNMNIVLCNGHTICTGLKLDELKEALGISFSCSIDEELAYRKKMYNKED